MKGFGFMYFVWKIGFFESFSARSFWCFAEDARKFWRFWQGVQSSVYRI